MFSKLSWFWTNPDECFICCSVDGKTDAEKQYEMMYNQKYISYPLLTLSKAYNCKCCNSYAHNKCLLNLNKCPTCRKVVSKPNLYVKTRYDYYLWFLLDWIKKDTSRIEKMKWCAGVYMIIMCLFLYSIDKIISKELFETIIPPKSNISLCFATIMGVSYFLACYTVILDDYFKKYWLYDSKTNKCHAL